MPSPYNSSLVSSINANAEYYGGPYDVYVSGLSADGVPTTSTLSAQQGFYVQPYVYTSNSVMTDPQQTSRLALSNVTINAGSSPLTLADDYFVGNNTVTGSDVTISLVHGERDLEPRERADDPQRRDRRQRRGDQRQRGPAAQRPVVARARDGRATALDRRRLVLPEHHPRAARWSRSPRPPRTRATPGPSTRRWR